MRRKDREVTEMEEIQQIFDECKVCRIGIMDENGPYIVPVNYGYVREEGKGTASIIDNPREKLKALNVIMKHQTGRTFDEFQKNPNLEKAVAIIRIDLNEYSCKKHI